MGQQGRDWMLIPWRELSEEALRGLLERQVLREGTDYGGRELGHSAKVDRLRAALERGDLVLISAPETDQVELVRAENWSPARE